MWQVVSHTRTLVSCSTTPDGMALRHDVLDASNKLEINATWQYNDP